MSRERLQRVLAAPALLVGAYALAQLITTVWGASRINNGALIGYGTVYGSLNALTAVGLILVYRSARVINFAIAGFGVASSMFYLLIASSWGWSWWVAFPAAIAAAAVTGWVAEVFIIRRFGASPRLVLTVATIALSQTLSGISLFMPRWFGYERIPNDPTGGLAGLPSTPPSTPGDDLTRHWDSAVFTGNHLMAVGVTVAVMVALGLFLRFSRTGMAVRGAAENTSRAQLLGINVNNLSSIIWVITSALAATGALLSAMVAQSTVVSQAGQALVNSGGNGLVQALAAGTVLRALTAAVIARMDRMSVAVAAAIAIAWFEQAVTWATPRASLVDVALLGAIVIALLTQRGRAARIDESETSAWVATDEIRPIPNELASLPQVRVGVRRTLIWLAVLVAAYPWLMSPSNTALGGVYAIYGIVGVSLVVLTGWGGQISLGQFGFVAMGASFGGYASADLGLPFPVALLIGAGVSGLIAVLIGLPALRIKGLFLAVTTLAFAIATSTWFLSQEWIPSQVSRPRIWFFDSRFDERSFYYVCVAALACTIFVAQGLRRSRTGRVLIAMRDNDRAAQAFGINLVRTRLTAFAISGAMAGFAGALYAFHQSSVSALAYGPEQSVQMFLMAVLGGLGSVYAVLVGAIYLATVNVVIDNAAGQLLASGTGVLLILLFFPRGLGALAFRARDAWLRRIALRNRIFVPTLFGDRLKEGEEARVAIAPPADERAEVEVVYRLDSNIGEAGASQLTKLWRY